MNSSKGIKWLRIADSINEFHFQDNNMIIGEADGRKFTLAKYKDRYFAFACKCPHAGGILADGYLDSSGNVVCPMHRYKFNIQNGRNASGEGYYLKTYPVELRAGGVFIGFENKGIFGWV